VLYKTFKLLTSFLISLAMLSCSCATTNSGNYSEDKLVLPVSSFLKIEASLVVRKCDDNSKECEVEKSDFISGSGFVVGKARNGGSFVMSAAHVCDPSDYADMVTGGTPYTMEYVGLTKDKEKFRMHILEVDHDTDLCLAWAPDLNRVPLRIAENKMLPGARIWNIAAPKGVLYRGAPIIIDGIFNGTNLDSGHDMYTMFVRGGSSGSCILNENHEVVGVVSMMDTRFGWIAISPRHEDVYEFYHRSIAYHKNVGAVVYQIALPQLPSLPKVDLPDLDLDIDLQGLAEDLLGRLSLK
jgi:hypothetical protein